MFVDIFKNGVRGNTRSSLIFCRSKDDGVKDQPLLRLSATAKFCLFNKKLKNKIESVGQVSMKGDYLVVRRSRPHQARKADVILKKAL